MKTIIEHVKSNGKYVGTLVACPDEEYFSEPQPNQPYSIGWSKFNYATEENIPVSDLKQKGIEIAFGRARTKSMMYNTVPVCKKDYDVEYMIFPKIPQSFIKNIDKFILRCNRYYKTINDPTNFGYDR